MAPAYLEKSKKALLMIDAQGFEWPVLDGAAETLSQVRSVLCELSLVRQYQGQRLWRDLIQRLEGEGFTLWFVKPGFVDNRDGRTLQFDAAFFKQ